VYSDTIHNRERETEMNEIAELQQQALAKLDEILALREQLREVEAILALQARVRRMESESI